MKSKLFFSLILAALVFVFTVFLAGGNLPWYIDVPSFLIVGLAPFLYQCVLFGFSSLGSVFTSPFKKNSSIAGISRTLDFFKSYAKSIWAFTVMAVGVSFIEILSNLTEPEKLGPNFAVAILCVLYAALINLLFILPYIAIARQRLTETGYEM